MYQNSNLYKLLCIFRVALLLIPQLGYIHPDEHFQGPEIAYGDFVGYKVFKTWEFTSSEPIRSIYYPYAVTVIPAMIVKLFTLLQYGVDSYLLLMLPRLVMCALSFLQDFCIYNICVTTGTNYRPSLLLFASSYVTLVYLTRTFSNSLESFLFAFQLLLLFKSYKLYQKLDVIKNSSIYFRQLMFFSFGSGITLSLGIFNRPTFMCFSMFPMIVWAYMFFGLNIFTKFSIITSFLLGTLSMSACLVLIDSFYYSKMNFLEINTFKFIYTPLNFITYNLDTSNLNNHGLHPRWLHCFVNIPLLFSIYGIILLFYFLKKVWSFFYRLKVDAENLVLLSFFTPLLLLSIIPHQEPRFLIPLLIPLCLIYNGPYLKMLLSNKLLVLIWFVSNMLLVLFYGFIHQAGIYLSMQYLCTQINNSSVVFYKTYMPPQYLLSLHESDKNTNVHDLAGIYLDGFESEIQKIISYKNPSKVFIVFPYKVLYADFTFEALTMSGFKFTEKIDLFPHLSTENLPKFKHIWHILQQNQSYSRILYDLKEIFSIQIILFKH